MFVQLLGAWYPSQPHHNSVRSVSPPHSSGRGWVVKDYLFFLLDTWTLSLLLHIDVFDPLFLSSFDFWSVRPSRCHCHYNWRRLSTASSFLIKHFVPAPKGAVLRLTACTMDFHWSATFGVMEVSGDWSQQLLRCTTVDSFRNKFCAHCSTPGKGWSCVFTLTLCLFLFLDTFPQHSLCARLPAAKSEHQGVCPNKLNSNLWVDAQSTCERECELDEVGYR